LEHAKAFAGVPAGTQHELGVDMIGLRRRISGPVLRLAMLALFWCGGTARADVLYQTGFEAPTYTTGDLNGQDGWGTTVPGAIQVESTTVHFGLQAVAVDLSNAPGSPFLTNFAGRAISYDSTANPGDNLRLQVSVLLQGTAGGRPVQKKTSRAARVRASPVSVHRRRITSVRPSFLPSSR
jgi:hypothetical protein